MTLDDLKNIEDPAERLTMANEMKQELEDAYHMCAKKEDIFFDETKRMIEDTLPPILKEATERLDKITEQTEDNIGKVKDMVSDTCKIFQETIELLQDDFLKKIKDIYSPLIDANTEMKVNRIQLDTPKSQNRESANHKEPPSEENILDIFADDMADILHMRKALLSSLQKIFVQLQLQRENTTQGPENLATIKQETFTAIEDFYSQASNGLRQYTLKLSATYGTAALSSLSARREEINAISQK